MLAHLFVFLADQLLRLGQRQQRQRDLCGALAGELTRKWGKGPGVKDMTKALGKGWGLGGGTVSWKLVP